MAREFQCKALNCTEKVLYEPRVISADSPAASILQTFTVYLKCPAGHELPYRISPDDSSGDVKRATP